VLGVTELMAHWALLVLARLDECCEFVECHPPARFVVGWREARRQFVVDGERIRAAAPIGERESDHHLATHRDIGRLEPHHFDHLLIWHEFYEAAVVRVGVGGRLASPGRPVVCERDSEQTTFASVEHMHVASHAYRHHPCSDRSRVEKRAINACARRVHVAAGVRRYARHKLIPQQRIVTPHMGFSGSVKRSAAWHLVRPAWA
jgi:hypothetical protein